MQEYSGERIKIQFSKENSDNNIISSQKGTIINIKGDQHLAQWVAIHIISFIFLIFGCSFQGKFSSHSEHATKKLYFPSYPFFFFGCNLKIAIKQSDGRKSMIQSSKFVTRRFPSEIVKESMQ